MRTLTVAAWTIAAGSLFGAPPALGYFMTGNTIMPDCQAQPAPTGACVAYVVGVIDGMWWGEPNMNCIPDGVTTGQLAQVVAKFLRDHPERLQLNAPVLIADAIGGAWPCPPAR